MQYENYTREDFLAQLDSLYAEAWMKGYTFKYIAEVAGTNKWLRIYKSLISQAIIKKARGGRPPKSIDIPKPMAEFLEVKKMSFRKWCNANGHDPIPLATGLMANEAWALTIVAKDFSSVFGLKRDSKQLPDKLDIPVAVQFTIEKSDSLFMATSSDYPGLSASAVTTEAALYQLKGKITYANRIRKMKNLLYGDI